jgi:ribosomal protein S27AE
MSQMIVEILKGVVDILGIILGRQPRVAGVTGPRGAEIPEPAMLRKARLARGMKPVGAGKRTKAGAVNVKREKTPERDREGRSPPKDPHGTKQCIRCGLTKGVTAFHSDKLECRLCERVQAETRKGRSSS